jgi:malate dehydrogenase (oxaloacetate-decarboxylating)(NADP+)
MKVACADALAELAREEVPDEVAAAYRGNRPKFGPEYIIPVPFDPRLISTIPPAVAQAAMDSGVARRPIVDMEAYQAPAVGAPRPGRRHPAADLLQGPPAAEARRLRRRRGRAGDPRGGKFRPRGSAKPS